MNPQIVIAPTEGAHNAALEQTIARLEAEGAYRDMSCVVVYPCLKTIPTKVVANWLGMFTAPNQRVGRLFPAMMEVGEAYSRTIEQVLADPNLSTYKYIVTVEADNTPPPDGIPRLLNSMERNPQYAAISGLYFTKGPGGVAQIWGDPKDPVLNFRPQKPDLNGGLVECNGTGMGFAAWRISMFKDAKLRRPWFKTTSDQASGAYTQDLYFWTDARKHGYKCAVDCSIKVGHYDLEGKFGPADFTW